jgi:hypothetical protein
MNRHLVSAVSGAITEFDPSELAHALRVACQGNRRIDLDLILTALHVLCDAQRPDGSWANQQPFFWKQSGMSASTLSVDTANAIVAAVTALLQNPERHGTNVEECSARLHKVYHALDQFFRWLSASLQSFPKPPALRKAETPADSESEPALYGWCSDRVQEQGRIHCWVTASALEFLVSFRRMQQERINGALRAEFLSYHPDELRPLSAVAPTDLDKMVHVDGGRTSEFREQAPIMLQLSHLLKAHKDAEFFEGPWFATTPPKLKLSFWSGLFYGPPGTSKTFLAEAIAGELRWPLISLSPADFLSNGAEHIEARAQEIFSALENGSRLVYFFDEFDELLRERSGAGDQQRNAFSLITPSFLTKLQDLRKAGKEKEFIFIVGTNYHERIDSAAKRSGRIDRQFLILYPDKSSRARMILDHLERPADTAKKILEDMDRAWGTNLKDSWKDITMKPDLYGESLKAKFVDIFATYTGALSYPRIENLIKMHLSKDRMPPDHGFQELISDLHQINMMRSARYKPEITLADYSERKGADDERRQFEALFPKTPFPWPAADGALPRSHLTLHQNEYSKPAVTPTSTPLPPDTSAAP